ncbi:MAG: response regulator [Acidobacteriota bacterium]
MPVLRLELLGDFQMRIDSDAPVNLSAKKSQALLAYLAVKPSQRVTRDKMAGLLWSSTAPEQARQSLRQTLSNLRKELAQISDQKILLEQGDLLGLDPEFVTADVVEFESMLATGTEESLAGAVHLYRGDFLDGLQLNEDRFDQWMRAERDRLHRAALRAHGQLIDLQTKRLDIDAAIGTAQRSLQIDALQEPVHRTLMRLFTQSGDLVNALQQYDVLAKTLKRELGVEPDAETKGLQHQIAQTRAKRNIAPETPAGDGRKTILVVEDNVLNRELTNAVLKAAGYSVMLAKDGAEALMLIGREKVDLILLDIDLPFIDGHSVLQAIRENGIEVPTIFVSGLPGDQPELKAFEIGAADFIHKPVKNNVLLARVAKVLKGE